MNHFFDQQFNGFGKRHCSDVVNDNVRATCDELAASSAVQVVSH